ncbi:hypothetical protein SAY87_017118 [Trapa incisa]|uniref:Uncharacterized protein n=1 Tax=Trapa incisa TaxID=236973 RepID=A0AAN7LJ30_9MYRT|nr:hypothetical protein SAY87_017118 [Trapa incisa]
MEGKGKRKVFAGYDGGIQTNSMIIAPKVLSSPVSKTNSFFNSAQALSTTTNIIIGVVKPASSIFAGDLCSIYGQMGLSTRHQQEARRLLGLVIGLILILGQCNESRATRNGDTLFLKVKKPPSNSNNFLDLLPKGQPFSYSGPSRKHNGIGLESWGRVPSSSSPP